PHTTPKRVGEAGESSCRKGNGPPLFVEEESFMPALWSDDDADSILQRAERPAGLPRSGVRRGGRDAACVRERPGAGGGGGRRSRELSRAKPAHLAQYRGAAR